MLGITAGARQRETASVGVVQFIVASTAEADINSARQIRILTAKNISLSEKFSVVNLEALDSLMRERGVSELKLYDREEQDKIPLSFVQFLVTGFISVEGKNYRVQINLLDLGSGQFLAGDEMRISNANEAALWDGVKTLTRRFLETSESLIFTSEVEPEKHYKVGDRGPAGGIIFYAKGARADGWRYLEAAPAETEARAPWAARFPDGFIAPSYLTTKSALGTGRDNTDAIIENSGANKTALAAELCRAVSFGGYTDWFLPSKDELMLMYKNLAAKGVGGFRGESYWSSTESSYTFAYFQNFRDGRQFFNGHKTLPMYVRAVRAF
jgi:hypothetical protein